MSDAPKNDGDKNSASAPSHGSGSQRQDVTNKQGAGDAKQTGPTQANRQQGGSPGQGAPSQQGGENSNPFADGGSLPGGGSWSATPDSSGVAASRNDDGYNVQINFNADHITGYKNARPANQAQSHPNVTARSRTASDATPAASPRAAATEAANSPQASSDSAATSTNAGSGGTDSSGGSSQSESKASSASTHANDGSGGKNSSEAASNSESKSDSGATSTNAGPGGADSSGGPSQSDGKAGSVSTRANDGSTGNAPSDAGSSAKGKGDPASRSANAGSSGQDSSAAPHTSDGKSNAALSKEENAQPGSNTRLTDQEAWDAAKDGAKDWAKQQAIGVAVDTVLGPVLAPVFSHSVQDALRGPEPPEPSNERERQIRENYDAMQRTLNIASIPVSLEVGGIAGTAAELRAARQAAKELGAAQAGLREGRLIAGEAKTASRAVDRKQRVFTTGRAKPAENVKPGTLGGLAGPVESPTAKAGKRGVGPGIGDHKPEPQKHRGMSKTAQPKSPDRLRMASPEEREAELAEIDRRCREVRRRRLGSRQVLEDFLWEELGEPTHRKDKRDFPLGKPNPRSRRVGQPVSTGKIIADLERIIARGAKEGATAAEKASAAKAEGYIRDLEKQARESNELARQRRDINRQSRGGGR